jgi:hypothetical protein
MTSSIATEYIARRMHELNYGNNYSLRFRHLVMQPQEKRTLDAANQLFLIVEPYADVRVESATGFFDLSDTVTSEMQYEHRGEITITCFSQLPTHVRFIQVIPKVL